MILVIDNYDSFTYNLVQYVGTLIPELAVYRNDYITLNEIRRINPDRIIISPGPGHPDNAGLSVPIVKEFSGELPILGICLGHQAIVSAFGGKITLSSEIVHGKTSSIIHNGSPIFRNIPTTFSATRYHSLVADRSSFPCDLKITSETSNGLIMSIEHKRYPVYGVQFHPESIVTEHGMTLIKNFLEV